MRYSEFLVLGIVAASLAIVMKRHHRNRTVVALARGQMTDHVRVAGPREMSDPPRNWGIVDETVDESFPASDPPANY